MRNNVREGGSILVQMNASIVAYHRRVPVLVMFLCAGWASAVAARS